ncbi:serine hydrolase domain-containing protein [Mycobacterium avium]|uniref:serine hydrolase domain-containing protein n=2 Tax=Mycobacterium avium TaxID=1764 RepID=UPI000BAFCB53|nr:serine hydrolase domain-containing protein [Mycobacterium avium]MDO2381982.1 serine hydrolase domain-containing protein [Mycobacterium avium subsp. hominissuis]MDO2394545.1 serine hydrolase domain-containing protein [Mycobacterium avium subsp. hominissuis]PBA13455.1 hypothetical protein CKJ69_17690 [Mycobacterium avium]PBA89497.1 hypothetical protein CKJ60_17690 [Mycobacterium avium]
MPNQVSGLAGYYFFLDGKQLNQTPVADGANFIVDGLSSNTDYSGRLTAAPVDKAGNIGAQVPFANAKTLNPTPDQNPMAADKVAAIDAIAARCIAAGAGPGLVVAIVGPDGYLTKAYGNGSATTDDHYLIASQTKMFTGTLVLMAVDKGLLSLDDPLSKYLSGYRVDPTIRQMLMMQSGLFDYEQSPNLGTNFILNPTGAMTVDQLIAIIKAGGNGATSEFPPGTRYYYTNSNHFVLAKILEAIDPAHRTYDQILQQDILTPLGLVNTRLRTATGTPPAPYAHGYDHNPILAIFGIVLMRDVSNQNPAYVWSAGGIDSVISDMVKWGKAFRDGTLLSPEMHQLQMTEFAEQPQTPPFGLAHTGPPTFGYGLAALRCGSWVGHDGSWLGYDSCTMVEPTTGTIISVYENFQTTSPNPLAAISTVWYEIATYLHPGSTNNLGYKTGPAITASVAAAAGGMSSAAAGAVYAPGEFQPFTEVNQDRNNQPIPDGCTGCYVTLLGAGGPGGRGTSTYNATGGSGGGGGGRINRIFIPRAELGDTYTAGHGVNGGDSVFTSGAIALRAGGGGAGYCTAAYGATAVGGAGGTWSATGLDGVTGANGSAGANSSMMGGANGNPNTDDAGPGGAGGRGSYGALSGAQTTGAASSTVPAGAAGKPGGDAQPGHAGASGGEGAAGGKYGAGGGGGYSYGNVAGQPGGPGADGLVMVEWV